MEWASRLPGATGKVGMYGASYGGATQLLAAVASPPALRCICPSFTSSDYFEGWTYEGGALHLAFVVYWALNLGTDTARSKGNPIALRRLTEAFTSNGVATHQASLPLREQDLFRESGVLEYYFDWLEHSTFDDYWKRIAVARRHH